MPQGICCRKQPGKRLTDRIRESPSMINLKLGGMMKRLARRAGIHVERLSALTCPRMRLISLLRQLGTEQVVDVGANTGQFAKGLRADGYQGRIISIEPLREANDMLRLAAKDDPNWIVAERAAIGSSCGDTIINVSRNGVSSSLLPINSLHTEAEQASITVGQETVSVTTLDELCKLYGIATDQQAFLKVDVQGYESQVLAGGCASLSLFKGVQLELSLVELYDGQALAWELIDLMHRHGFALWSLERGFSDPRTGQLMQCDGIFVQYKAV